MRRNVPLSVLAGIALAVCLADTSRAERPNPQMRCKRLYADQVRCEAKYVWPVIPEWRAGEKDYGKGYGEGFGMTMKIPETWTLVQMRLADHVLAVEARMVGGKVEFRLPTKVQVASQPP